MDANIGILGGGIAGLSVAYFLNDKSVIIIEKNERVGGLCRSFTKNGIVYDIGPHILFSKNEATLNFINSISNNQQHRRSNQIFLNGNFIKYPFENHLAQLNDRTIINYCLNTFLNNPYEYMPTNNMLAFFLKTFGEGITKIYFQPYNEKIWKFDPSMMDTQMVERIPNPPKEHIIQSTKGVYSEGYTHQLHFTYPKKGGVQSIVDSIHHLLLDKGILILNNTILKKVRRTKTGWVVITKSKTLRFARLINCMPIHELIEVLEDAPNYIQNAVANLKYNSICIIIINVKKDKLGDNFSITLPQKDVLFHRVNKLDFLGKHYHLKNSSTLMLEITFREGDIISQMKDRELIGRCIADLTKIGFIESNSINFTDMRKEKYAYVIYDLEHRKNSDLFLNYLKGIGIESAGRFAEFKYYNTDHIIARSMELTEKINGKIDGAVTSTKADCA